jgi:outer membrane protein assembly factor BamB
MRILPAIALLLLLCPLIFPAVLWSAAATDSVTGLALVGNKAIYSSYDGSVYAANADTGAILWVADLGGRVSLAPEPVDEKALAVATEDGRLLFMAAQTGKVQQSVELGGAPLSLAAGSGRVFVGFNDSVSAYGATGKSLWRRAFGSGIGEIGYASGTLYFYSGGKLYSLDEGNGATLWSTPMIGSFFSRPVEYDGNVYVGATDGKLYSFDYVTGAQQWEYRTDGWVMSSPVATSKSVYFGSNDGYLYSVSLSGRLNWKFKTGEAVWSSPLIHESTDGLLVIFGSNDGNIYALDTDDGKLVWSFSAYGKPGQLSEHQGAFVFGTSRGKVYSLAASPVCSFTYPAKGEAVGNWSVDVEGTAYSDAGLRSVEVRAGQGAWIRAIGTEKWYAPINFAAVAPGAVNVECRAIDGAARKEQGDYSFLSLVVSENAPIQKMSVAAPQQAKYNESFKISAKDGRGADLHGLSVKVGGGEAEVKDSPFFVVLGKTGRVEVSIAKPGFEPYSFWVEGAGGDSPILPIAAAAAALVALYFLFGRKMLEKALPAFMKK